MGLPFDLREDERLMFCPVCGEPWLARGLPHWQNTHRCWCNMRQDVAEGASLWDAANYPATIPFPDQDVAWATFRTGGEKALEELGQALVRASTEHASS